jgi:hypothetical protein
MAAVEILKQILECNDEDLKPWAFNFSTTQGDMTYRRLPPSWRRSFMRTSYAMLVKPRGKATIAVFVEVQGDVIFAAALNAFLELTFFLPCL